MATKTTVQTPAKSTVETSDSFMLSTSNGMQRITRANAQNFIKDTMGGIKETSLSIAKDAWVRIASSTASRKFGVFFLNTGYTSPPHFQCVALNSYAKDKNVSGIQVIFDVCGTDKILSFTQMRVVLQGSTYYVEVKAGKTTSLIDVGLQSNYNLNLVTPTISDASDDEVIDTYDLTNTASAASLQSAEEHPQAM